MRFNHVTLTVAELERAKVFYATLGLVQIVDAPPSSVGRPRTRTALCAGVVP
jgi:catechol 2,3-dioxygenase-like lactoylglutathione lyase family enzyme